MTTERKLKGKVNLLLWHGNRSLFKSLNKKFEAVRQFFDNYSKGKRGKLSIKT
jgi:hypothetical protein